MTYHASMQSIPPEVSLEELFFSQDDPGLAESLREFRALREAPGLLAEVTGLPHPLANALMTKGLGPGVGLVLVLWPLVETAWADGVTPAERKAVFESLDQALFFPTVCRDVAEAWLDRRPAPEFARAWEAEVDRLVAELLPLERRQFGDALLGPARKVASAGFFGGISQAERLVLDRIQKVVSSWP